MTLFSIVVVSYNTKKDFIKTISSIKKQTFRNYEIIIVDGLSTDGTVDYIKKIKGKKIKAIIKKDQGIYDAMNKGVKKSKSEWVIFLNSGDVFHNNKVLKKISKKQIDNKDILFGDSIVDNGYFNFIVKAKMFEKNTFLMPFCHQSSIVRRNLLLKYQFSLNYKIASDFDFFENFSNKNFSFFYIKTIVSKVSGSGLSDLNRNKVYNEYIRILIRNDRNYLLIFKILIYKYINYFKNVLKLILPNSWILNLLRIKYKHHII